MHRRRGPLWGSRYKAILVSQEEAAQAGRFRYILAQSVKEGLVAHARDWPGIHSVREVLAGEPIRGTWFDRTQEYGAKNRGKDFGRLQYATEEAFELTPLPRWAHLPQEVYRQRVAELVEEIESEAAAELAKSGREPLGVAAVRRNPSSFRRKDNSLRDVSPCARAPLREFGAKRSSLTWRNPSLTRWLSCGAKSLGIAPNHISLSRCSVVTAQC